MVTSIRAASTYLSKYFDSLGASEPKKSTWEPPSRCSMSTESLPPYGDSLAPPSYTASLGGLSLVDRVDRSFKIYERDLMALSVEWSKRRHYKGYRVPGGPSLAPRRILEMQDLFDFIIRHKTCQALSTTSPCDCRSVRWAILKKEWCEVMDLLGISIQ